MCEEEFGAVCENGGLYFRRDSAQPLPLKQCAKNPVKPVLYLRLHSIVEI